MRTLTHFVQTAPALVCAALLFSLPVVRVVRAEEESARVRKAAPAPSGVVDAGALRGKVLCGYQGWFRGPGDGAKMGWVHWSRQSQRLTAETLSFEMWPETSELTSEERIAAPGFSHPDGSPAFLFSSVHPKTVLRHFAWMRDSGIDGVWLQRFLVDLVGGPLTARSASSWQVLRNVRAAARETGRTWAITFDLSGVPMGQVFTVLTTEWKRLVDEGFVSDGRYLQEGGRPVVQVWGFYRQSASHPMTAELANQLIAFFHAPGPYRAFLVGGGDWNWRHHSDPEWQATLRRLDGYSPWNVGNLFRNAAGEAQAATDSWAEDKRACERAGLLWIPVIYPGFSWDNLQRLSPGKSMVSRRGGQFLWEQFHVLSELGTDSACVAMFDEVDEGTAIFKVTNTPPVEARFLTYDGLPSDWYLRLVGEGTRRLRRKLPVPAAIPILP